MAEAIHFSNSLRSTSSSLKYYHRLLHKLHLKEIYYTEPAMGATLIQERHGSLPAVGELIMCKRVLKKHLLL